MYKVIVPLIAPLMDISTLIIIVVNIMSYLLYGSPWYLDALIHISLYVGIFYVLDFLVALIAFTFEPDEDKRALWYFLPQRLAYRFFMYYINLRALSSALK